MMNNKVKRIAAGVIAGLLVVSMVAAVFLPYIQ